MGGVQVAQYEGGEVSPTRSLLGLQEVWEEALIAC
jgi:hypothetical protein